MKPTKMIVRRDPSAIATCSRELARQIHHNEVPTDTRLENLTVHYFCGAPMQLVIKEPKTWSYQERVSERCIAGHIAHAQAVVVESEIEEGC